MFPGRPEYFCLILINNTFYLQQNLLFIPHMSSSVFSSATVCSQPMGILLAPLIIAYENHLNKMQ